MKKKIARAKEPPGPKRKPKQKNKAEGTENQIAYLASLIEHVSDALISIDTSGNILSWNSAAERMYGWKAGDVIGHPIDQFLKTEYPGETNEHVPFQLGLGASHWEGEVIQRNKDGVPIQVMASVSPVSNKDGKIIGLIGVNRDITERKKAQEALSEFRKVMDESNDAIFMIDPRTSRYIDFNKTACERLGYNREELSQLSMLDVVEHITSLDIWNERVELVRKTGGLLFETNYRCKDGTLFPVETSVRMMGHPNEVMVAIVRDITERKRVQQILLANEKYFRALIENNTEGIVLVDAQGIIKYASPAITRILGYEIDEYVGLNAFTFIHPDDLQVAEGLFGRLLEKPYESIVAELRERHKDGSWRWLEGYAVNLLNDSAVQAIITNFRDITERKRTEQELRDSEERFRELADNIEEVFWITEPESKKDVYVSPAAVKIWGRAIENNNDLIESVVPEDRPAVLASIEKQSLGQRTELEYRIQHSDGSTHWIWDRAFPVFDEMGKLVRVAGIAADVTERKRIAEALQEREERLRTLFTILPVGISIVDEQRRILETNPALEKILNLSKEALLKGEYILHHKYLDKDNAPLSMEESPSSRAIKEQKEILDVEIGVVYEDKQIVWTQVSAAPLPDQGAVVVTVDITGRKRAEETIYQYATELERRVEERTADLTRANRAKDEFLANMSHELRTPLNSIMGYSEALLEGVRGPLNEKQQNGMEMIMSSGQHLLGLINDILDVSKIEAGKLDFHPQIIDATEVCQASLVFVSEMATKKSVLLEFEPLPTACWFLGDSRRMKQILVNLLSNSIKFTPENGKVTLNVHTDAKEDQIHFSVVDTGIGIAPEDLKRLFYPFVQVDSSLTREHEGSGLGLALVHKLVEMHGGNVSVKSEVGRGSSFSVTLPWNQKINAAGDSHPLNAGSGDDRDGKRAKTESGNETPAGIRGSVLVAEDKEANVMVIKDYLEYRGYQVIVAHNGVEALAKTDEFLPDAILMDIQMPQMDGLEAIQRLRSDPRFSKTPIIAITAFAMPGDRERCIAAGANEYLSKPISLKTLKEMIERFLK